MAGPADQTRGRCFSLSFSTARSSTDLASSATAREPGLPMRPTSPLNNRQGRVDSRVLPGYPQGFTLPELLIGVTILVIGVVAMLGAVVSQVTLNEHARNLSWASNDATRVMERLRQQNSGSGCTTPSDAAPAECDPNGNSACTGAYPWDQWLAGSVGGGKSGQPTPTTNELVVVTKSGTDPLTLTVAVCWRHRGRVIGECAWNGSALVADESLVMASDTAAIDSPAMLSTLMTCRK